MNPSAERALLVPSPRPALDEAMPGAVIDLRGILGAFRRRWTWILVPALLFGGLALAVALSLPARYEAAAKVLLDPRGIQILQNDLRPTNTTGDETGAEVDSQVQVVASTSLLRRVIAQLDLTADREFTDPPPSLVARLTRVVQDLLGTAPTGPPEPPAQRALRTLLDDLSVRRSEKTFVIDIGVRTGDPDKSARIANAVAEAFVRETSTVRSETARRSSTELGGQLDQLRARLERSEAAVEAYRKRSDLVGANGRLVTEQQLADLNTQLTLARARAADQQARIAEIQRMGSGGNPADALSEVANSPTMIALRAQYTEAARAEADARMNYGPRHPAMQNAQKQLQTVRQRIGEEVARLTRTAQSDYERARASQASITTMIESLKRENATANAAQVQLRELERQASADRSVYESFLNRAKDLDERRVLDNANARVITEAVAPLGRSGLSRVLLVAGGLGFGTMLGLGLALLRDQTAAPRATAQEIWRPERALPVPAGLPMLTVAPSGTPQDPIVRQVRGLLPAVPGGGPARLVVVAGLKAAGARARLALILARLNAGEGERTLLIDGDFENRSLTTSLNADDVPGLADALAVTPLPEMPLPRSFDGLQIITAGLRETRGASVNIRTVRQVLDPFLRQPGLIIVDAGSLGDKANAFAALADDILIVVEGGPGVRRDVAEALDALAFNGESVRGVLIAQNGHWA